MVTTTRPLYGRAELERLLAPRSIAIVGVSQKPDGFGNRTLANMDAFQGEVYIVNPKYGELEGRKCYPSLAALPQSPDCVVVALPREGVEGMLRQCVEVKAGGAILYASGFGETGKPERQAEQDRLVEIARAGNVRLLGPNCIGIVNNLVGAGAQFQPEFRSVNKPGGRIGIVSQSGALGYSLGQGAMHGTIATHIFASGNSCDVDVCDLASYLLEVPECRAVAFLFEGAKDPGRLLALGKKSLAVGKPIVTFKMGTGESGAAAARSHTGTLAGSAAAYRAAFQRGGFIAAAGFEEVMEHAAFLAKAPKPRGAGVGVMATSGGAAVMAADVAEDLGMPMPQPGKAAAKILRAEIPDFGSARNPCDVTAQVLTNPDSFKACADAMLADPAYGAMIVPVVTSAAGLTEARVPLMSEFAARHGKPICIVWLTEWREGPGAELYEKDPHVARFGSMRSCFGAIRAWQEWHALRAGAQEAQKRLSRATKVLPAGKKILAEKEAKKILAKYGIRCVPELAVKSAEDAVKAASRLGYPVVLKADSPKIAHKTEAGAVALDLRDAGAVRAACKAMKVAKGAFLVQPMLKGGIELVVGTKRDPQFGPLLLVGLGGVLVEVMRDTATSLAPVGKAEALRMLRRLRGFRLLEGYRGAPAAHLDALCEAIARISELAADHRDRIEELDVNPLLARADGAVALDALIVLREGKA
jgi:acyl-CoA synthetase (NDP forming)